MRRSCTEELPRRARAEASALQTLELCRQTTAVFAAAVDRDQQCLALSITRDRS
jgi:hypothetical protein